MNRPGGFVYVVWMSALGGPEQAGDHVTVSACVCLSTDVCVCAVHPCTCELICVCALGVSAHMLP